MKYEIWNMKYEFELWHMNMKYDIWHMTYYLWHMIKDYWILLITSENTPILHASKLKIIPGVSKKKS